MELEQEKPMKIKKVKVELPCIDCKVNAKAKASSRCRPCLNLFKRNQTIIKNELSAQVEELNEIKTKLIQEKEELIIETETKETEILQAKEIEIQQVKESVAKEISFIQGKEEVKSEYQQLFLDSQIQLGIARNEIERLAKKLDKKKEPIVTVAQAVPEIKAPLMPLPLDRHSSILKNGFLPRKFGYY